METEETNLRYWNALQLEDGSYVAMGVCTDPGEHHSLHLTRYDENLNEVEVKHTARHARLSGEMCIRDRPVLISASVSVAMVFAGSQEQALAAELALAAFTAEETGTASAYLLSDSPPVEDPGYPEALAFFQAQAGAQRDRLAQADLSPDEYRDEELLLEEYQANLDRLAAGQGRYLISPQDLEAYRRCLPALSLQPHHPFLSTSQGEVNMLSLIHI